MADTVRTLAALKTLLADNTTGLISPQDLRDLLVSLIPGHGSIYISAPAATTIAQAGTFVKAAGTTTAAHLDTAFDMPADNRLRYVGATAVHATVSVTLSFTCAGNNQDLAFQIHKNGDPVTGSHISVKIGTGTDERSTALHVDADLAQNDYLEVWITNATGTAAVTLTHLYLHAATTLA